MLEKVPSAIKWISAYLFFSAIAMLFLLDWTNVGFLTIIDLGFVAVSLILGINLLRLLDWTRTGTLILLFCALAFNLLYVSFESAYDFGYTFGGFLIKSIIPVIIIKYLFKHKKLKEIKVSTSKNKSKFSSKWYFWVLMVVGGILFAIIIIALLVGMGSTSTTSIDTQSTNTQVTNTPLIDTLPANSSTCESPKEIIGEIDCCIPNTDYGVTVCSEEAEKMKIQVNYALDNNITTTKQTEEFLGKFNLMVPEGYVAIRNTKVGLFDYPLILMGYDESGNRIMITAFYSEGMEYTGSIEEAYSEIKIGLEESSPNSTFTEPEFLENKERGTETAIVNSPATVNDQNIFASIAFIKSGNKLLSIRYNAESKELFDYYHSEFEEMVDSVKFN